jgi:bacteriorhodopsin
MEVEPKDEIEPKEKIVFNNPTVDQYIIPTSLSISIKITSFILFIASFVTFYGWILVKNRVHSRTLLIECIISSIASTIYFFIDYSLRKNVERGEPIKWLNVVYLRYLDWALTTPFLLLVLSLVLCYNSPVEFNIVTMITVIILDYIMLFFGYLGETGSISRMTACALGFVPMIALFLILANTYLLNAVPGPTKRIVFYLYLILWAAYGMVYMFNNIAERNTITNYLDALAKGGIGLGLTAKYMKWI